jgi:hypothetical protein
MAPSSSVSRFGPIFLLCLLIAGFYWKLTLTNQYEWMSGADLAEQVLPWFDQQAREIHQGRIPLWDTYLWSGQPLLAQGQPGTAYPLNWLLFALPLQNGHIAPVALAWYYVVIHFMAALFAYLFCRDLGRSPIASIAGGLIFALSGFLGATDWPQMMNGAVWAPLVFLFQLRAIRPAALRWSNAALSGLFLGISFLSGHHQIPIFVALAWIAIWIWFAFRNRRMIPAAAIALIIAALTGALQTLPALEYGRLARRWVGGPEPLAWNQTVPYTVQEHYDLKAFSLLGIVFPDVKANFDPFVGVVALTVALLAIAAAWKDSRVRLLSALALGAILYALGHNIIFQGILYSLIPGLDKARVPSAAVLLFQCAVAALAAFGFDHLDTRWTRTAQRSLIVFSVVTLLASVWALLTHSLKFPADDRIILTAVFALLLALSVTRASRPACLLLLLLELGNYSQIHLTPRNDPARMSLLRAIRANPEMAGHLQGQAGFPRVQIANDAFAPNWGAYQGVEMFGGKAASVTANILDSNYFSESGRSRWGVAYTISATPPPGAIEEGFATTDGFKIYRREAFPRAWAVHESCAGPDHVDLIEHLSDRLAIRADLSCPGMVILSDTFYPGWRARVDHEPANIYEVNGAMRGVRVPSGSHTITMRYRPLSVYLGAALTLLGVIAAASIYIFDA